MKTGIAMALAAAGLTIASGTALAHHSFAMFDSSQHMLVEGEVTSWAYNSPHSWLIIQGVDKDGVRATWSFEGGAPVHLTRQGVTGTTFKKGELVRVVMSPLRDGRNAGALCFVEKADGSITRPNDGICDSEKAIKLWQDNDWLESAHNLDTHPAPARR
jgi:hypothetical protein